MFFLLLLNCRKPVSGPKQRKFKKAVGFCELEKFRFFFLLSSDLDHEHGGYFKLHPDL